MNVHVHLLKPLCGWLTNMSSQYTWSYTSLGPFALLSLWFQTGSLCSVFIHGSHTVQVQWQDYFRRLCLQISGQKLKQGLINMS